MKHILRLLVALSAAVLALVLNYNAAGSEFFDLPSTLPSVIAVFALSVCLLYLDVLLRRVSTEQVLSLAVAGLVGLLAAFLLQNVFLEFQAALQKEALAVYLVVVLFFAITGKLAADFFLTKFGAGKDGSDGSVGARDKILDTSVIIDGRILDIAETHFIDGPFIIPNYVLREIQLISDSPDPIKRNRGRRGLEMLNKLQNHSSVKVKISYRDYSDIREVDAKLVRMSRETGAKLITNDFNLNMVAELQGVQVLNLNNLTNALKPVVLPGEDILIDVIKEGKDENQGIGYLEDGTMVVIENGGNLLGKSVRVNVTSIIQTAAGKMIFTRAAEVIEDNRDSGSNGGGRGGRGRRGGRGGGGGGGGGADRGGDRGGPPEDGDSDGDQGRGRGRGRGRDRGDRDRGGDRENRGPAPDRGGDRDSRGNERDRGGADRDNRGNERGAGPSMHAGGAADDREIAFRAGRRNR